MIYKIVVCIVIICCTRNSMRVVWCKPLAQYGFNQSLNSARNANWQNPNYRDANSYGIDSMPATSRPLYPTLQPNYQPNMGPWNNNNNNIYPQVPHDNDGQRSVNPAVYPLQPNLDHSNPTNDHQATIPPFKDNGPYNNPGARYQTRPQITPTRPATITVTGPTVVPYNRTLPTNQPAFNYNNNYHINQDDRYNGGVHPNSQFNNTRNYNPKYPNQGVLNANRNGTEGMYNYRPQPFDNRPGQPYNQNSNVQRPINPYSGYNNIGQSNYNSPSNNNNGQLPYNGQSNVGQSSYNGPSNYNSFNNNNNNPNPINNNNAISNRNSFEPSVPSNNNVKYNSPPAQPDYDPNGIALAPFPENDRLFNPQNLLGRQQPSKYNNPSSSYNKDTLHVPLAPFPIGPS